MAYGGGQYTMTTTATNLTSALGLVARVHCKNIDIKGKSTNTGAIYVGASNVTNAPANARAEIPSGQAWSSGPHDGSPINTDEVYIVGTAADIAFITLII